MTIAGKRTEAAGRRFPSPSDVSHPAGCEGWEEMYPYHALFSEDRREFDESRFWFQDGVALPRALLPVRRCDVLDYVPPRAQPGERPPVRRAAFARRRVPDPQRLRLPQCELGHDEATLARRAELFAAPGRLLLRALGRALRALAGKGRGGDPRARRRSSCPSYPSSRTSRSSPKARGVGSSHALLVAYDRLLEGLDRILQYHFEFLNLGYGAYLVFYELCRGPSRDHRPDDREDGLRASTSSSFARTRSSGVSPGSRSSWAWPRRSRRPRRGGARRRSRGERCRDSSGSPTSRRRRTRGSTSRYGNGLFYHHHRSWIDDTTLPIATIGSYIERLEAGEDISRPSDGCSPSASGSPRSTAPCSPRRRGRSSTRASRSPAPSSRYVENHDFYIDHRYFTIFWNKVREFGALLARHGFLGGAGGRLLPAPRRGPLSARGASARLELRRRRAPRGPAHWPPIVERRKSIYEAMRAWAPPPALGQVPEEITRPEDDHALGDHDRAREEWLSSGDDAPATLTGLAGSPGVAEGPARVILRADQLGELEDGEILVAPSTSTSWTPVFGTIAAAVLDTGGIMCHAAIVAREYGLPAVVGTGTATKTDQDGRPAPRRRLDRDRHPPLLTRLDLQAWCWR